MSRDEGSPQYSELNPRQPVGQFSSPSNGKPVLIREASRTSSELQEASKVQTEKEASQGHSGTAPSAFPILHPSQSLIREHSAFATLVDKVLAKRAHVDNERQGMTELQKHVNNLYGLLLSNLNSERSGIAISGADRSLLERHRQLEEVTQDLTRRGDRLAELELDLGAAEYKLKSRETILYNETLEALQGVGSRHPASEQGESSVGASEEAATDPKEVQDYYSLLGDISNLMDALNEHDIEYQQDMVERERATADQRVPDTHSKDLFNEYIRERETLVQEIREAEKTAATLKQQCVAAGFTLEDDERPYFPQNVSPVPQAMDDPSFSSPLINTASGVDADSGLRGPVRYVFSGAQAYTNNWLTEVLTTDGLEPPQDPGDLDLVPTQLVDEADDGLDVLTPSSDSGIDEAEAAPHFGIPVRPRAP